MKKAVLILIVITIFSKFLGLGREISLSYYYGASYITDAYLISFTIPGTIFAFIGIGITTGFIPIYTQIVKQNGKRKAEVFTNNVLIISCLISIVLTIIVLIFTEPLVRTFASGFDDKTLNLAVKFTKISIVGIIFSAINFVFTAYLHSKNNFSIPAILGLPFNLTIILSISLSFYFDNYLYLGYGLLFSMIAQTLFLLPFIKKEGYQPVLTHNILDEHVKKLFYLALPLIVGVSANQINVLVDRTMASNLSIGAISSLNYSNRLLFFIQSIFVTSFVTVLFPNISKLAAGNNVEKIKENISRVLVVMFMFVMPITLFSLLFSKEIIELVYGRGSFDANAVNMTTKTFFYYVIGLLGIGLRELLANTFYSLQDTKTPTKNALIAVSLNIILNIIFSFYMGVGGLALATTISAIVCSLLLYINLQKKIGVLFNTVYTAIMQIIIFSLLMAATSYIIFNLTLFMDVYVSLPLCLIVGIGLYIVLLNIFKVKEFLLLKEMIKNKLHSIIR